MRFEATFVVLSAMTMLISFSESAHSLQFVNAKIPSSKSRVSPLMFQNSESTPFIHGQVRSPTACSLHMCSKQTGNSNGKCKTYAY